MDASQSAADLLDAVELIDAAVHRRQIITMADWDESLLKQDHRDQMRTIPLSPHDWHGEWNYTITHPTTRLKSRRALTVEISIDLEMSIKAVSVGD